ncbi:MAG: radical SAM protein [Nitrospirae bacterium]|nr:radical SAM protein [Nitrospirota bacterium]MBF0536204.1 radical SAM protein [Nitrospirota bacterium]MBF0617320.1 radical SAM protein [Nitrospirota bacterium]
MKKIQKRILTDDKVRVDHVNYIHVYITKHCNLQCPHCFTNSSPAENFTMPLDFWLDVFRQMSDLEVKTVHIEGGEPILYPGIEKLVSYIAGSRIKELLIVSNGIAATKEKLKELKQAGLKKIAISLDSIEESVHNELRAPSFKYAMRAIEDAISLGFFTRVSSVITKKNIGLIGKFLDYLTDVGVSTVNLDWFNGAGRGVNLKGEYEVTYKDIDLLPPFEAAIESFMRDRSRSGTTISVDLPQWYEKRGTFLVTDPVRTHHLSCDGIVKQLSVDEKGRVLPCFIFSGGPEALGSLTETSLEGIIYGRKEHLPIRCPIGVSKHIFYQSTKDL